MVRKQSGGGGEVAEVNLVVLQMKGDSGVLAKSIDALVHALQKPNGNALRGLGPTAPSVLPAHARPSGQVEGQGGVQRTDDVMGATVEGEVSSPAASAEVRPRKQRAFAPVDPLPDLTVNDAPDPFREFVDGRTVTGMNDRGLVAATWVRDKRAAKQFGVRHLATCFRAMSWKMPDDPASLLRNMKKANLLKHAGTPGLYELTTVGDKRYAEI